MDARDSTVGAVLRSTFRLIGRHRRDFAVAGGLLVVLPILSVPMIGNASATMAVTAGYLRWYDPSATLLFPVSLLGPCSLLLMSLVLFGIVVRAARDGVDGGAVWACRVAYAALSAGLQVVGSAAPAAAYVELDRVKGGLPSADLVEAFA